MLAPVVAVVLALGSYGFLWDPMGSYGFLWVPMPSKLQSFAPSEPCCCPSFAVVVALGSYGFLWVPMGSYALLALIACFDCMQLLFRVHAPVSVSSSF